MMFSTAAGFLRQVTIHQQSVNVIICEHLAALVDGPGALTYPNGQAAGAASQGTAEAAQGGDGR